MTKSKALKKKEAEVKKIKDTAVKDAQDIRDKAAKDAQDIRDKAAAGVAEAKSKIDPKVSEEDKAELIADGEEIILKAAEDADELIKLADKLADQFIEKADAAAEDLLSGSKETGPGQEIAGVALHCSGSNLPKHDDIKVVDYWHKRRGFKMKKPLDPALPSVGYHYFIKSTGEIQRGRRLDDDSILEWDEIGAHVFGKNRRLIGVCLHGIDATDFTIKQFHALKTIIEQIADLVPKIKVYGHNYFTDKKTCPNFDWRKWVEATFPDMLPE